MSKSTISSGIYQKISQRILPDPPAKPEDGLEFWQQKIFQVVSLCMILLGLGAYIPGVIQFVREEIWLMVVLDTIFYILTLLIAFIRKTNLKLRFAAVLMIFSMVGIALFFSTGTAGSGPSWLFTFSILAGIFFGLKGALISLGTNFLFLIAYGILIGIFTGNTQATYYMPPSAYITIGLNFFFLNALISISISALSSGLANIYAREKETSTALKNEQIKLISAKNALNQEISEHKQTEQQLKIKEERLRLALEAIHDGLWDWDLLTNEVYYSPRWKTMLGYSPSEIKGYANAWSDLIHPDDSEKTLSTLQEHIDGKTPSYESQHRLRSKNGDWVWVLDRGKIVEHTDDGSPIRMTGTLTDITARKRIEAELERERRSLAKRVDQQTAELQKSNLELINASQLKDNFLASISHELRTPLNAILGFSEALIEGIYGPLQRQQSDSINRIQDSGAHLLSLIDDILDISKLQSGEFHLSCETINIFKLVNDCISLIDTSSSKKQISVIPNLDSNATTFFADPRRFKQILLNLLNNAIKFTPEGGTVGLDVKLNPKSQTITFSVWDTGIGIADENISQIFKPFIQLDSSLSRLYDGTGLGLALVKSLVELHQGTIEVLSQPNIGSRFTISIPWSTTSTQPDVTSKTTIVEQTNYSIQKALIIEDSDIIADLIKRYLNELGITSNILTFADNYDFTKILEEEADVIFLDILLPQKSGWEILKQLKENIKTKNTPVIIVSVVNEPEKSLALGASVYLQKPISRSSLAQALQNISNGNQLTEISKSTNVVNNLILLAEDNHSNAETILDYLEVNGYKTIWAQNGIEAIKKAKQNRPCLILMDMQMPEMDGMEAIRQIRLDKNLASTPILALTALAMPGDKERFLTAGANAYLSKPVSLKSLKTAIKNLLGD